MLFHKCTVSSEDAEAIRLPKGFMATSLTEVLWPMNLNGLIFCLKFHTNMLPSSLPVIACFLYIILVIYYISGVNIQELIVSVFPLNERLIMGSEKKQPGLVYNFIFILI